MLSEKKASHFEDVTNAKIEPNGSNETEPKHAPASARRKLFSFGIPAAAAMLATACGKAVFGGDQKRIKKDGSGDAASTSAAIQSKPSVSPSVSPIENKNVDGQTGNGNGDGDNSTIGNENMTGSNGNATNNNGGMNNGGMNNGGGGNGGGGPVTDDPCNGIGIAVVETKDIRKDSSIIDATGTAGGLKIWGRHRNAMVVVALAKNTSKGSTVLLASPIAPGSTQVNVLASRLVINEEVDAKSNSAMIIFDSINLSLLAGDNPELVVIVLAPGDGAKKEVFTDRVKSFHDKSKRYAFSFKGKPVVDIQVGFLAPEDVTAGVTLTAAQKNAYAEPAIVPTFPTDRNKVSNGQDGFGHDRSTTEAIVAENLRTAGYQTSPDDPKTPAFEPDLNPSETAHITHAKTKWKYPEKFKSSGTIVTDLLEREISDKFESGGSTNYLKDDYTFVVYRPDNATTPSIYYRYMIAVG